ncbi:hypothetical protein PHSC3_001357 [Chlamydiales bacterium STE3]|nr:hypothetical protein PHSC3_001357 [Chlamydiales bacterium STE3]
MLMPHKQLYACLPFVEFTREKGITLGPIHFWPSSTAKVHLPENFSSLFEEYIATVDKFSAKDLPRKAIACISINDTVPKDRRGSLLIDGIYLLYFASNFRNVYYSNEILKLSSFTKILPASEEIIKDRKIWTKTEISEGAREKAACISWVDEEIAQALGKALSIVYDPTSEYSAFDESIRLIRAIRFFVDRFFSKFENLLSYGLDLPPNLFEPEDILFLASSFDVLLTINDQQPASDFRQKVRPMLHLKFSKPVELFWKWVESFYLLKKQVIQGISRPEDLFTANPNFNVPLMHIGIKLFIYVLYYKLYENHWIASESTNRFIPPDFHWIHPQEILNFFWTEESILRKTSLLLMQRQQHREMSQENQSDLYLLSALFTSLMEKFYFPSPSNYIKYIPTPESLLEPYITPILNYGLLSRDLLHPDFLTWLKKRGGIIS